MSILCEWTFSRTNIPEKYSCCSIVDKDLKSLRNVRWDKAFKDVEEDEDKDVNRKATIVIEHLIQASDVAHTMQVRLLFSALLPLLSVNKAVLNSHILPL